MRFGSIKRASNQECVKLCFICRDETWHVDGVCEWDDLHSELVDVGFGFREPSLWCSRWDSRSRLLVASGHSLAARSSKLPAICRYIRLRSKRRSMSSARLLSDALRRSRAVFAGRLAKQVRYLLHLPRPRVSKPRDQNKRPFPWKFVNRRPIRSPLGRWETITFVAALRHNKMVAPMVVEGAMTGEMFLAYVENCLVPTLRRNDIVVMDNCRVHLGTGIGRAIETVGATPRYLPKYSPDLNPIEMPYSKFKTFLRKVAARTIPSLNRAIRSFIPQLSPQECANYFRHAGYVSI